ncbi:hypothetical protein ANN_12134 [Periplaneta americana]|uniref:Uncharacterized protein n=1 Tax=Periplaneta americana TaxID=6978 RepID=A0ABQ8T7P8_PERAM|nr:hypothetical protein ANN_12134 [Periplaneta americana]
MELFVPNQQEGDETRVVLQYCEDVIHDFNWLVPVQQRTGEIAVMCFCGKAANLHDLPEVKFSNILDLKLKSSFIGCFLKHLNIAQSTELEVYEEKLELTEFVFHQHEDESQDRKNDVTVLDPGLLKLHNLQSLSLPANWLRLVQGALLPRRLKLLELFGNAISDVTALCSSPPTMLLHLGLARNELWDVFSDDCTALAAERDMRQPGLRMGGRMDK